VPKIGQLKIKLEEPAQYVLKLNNKWIKKGTVTIVPIVQNMQRKRCSKLRWIKI
jgi:hypothetical protein